LFGKLFGKKKTAANKPSVEPAAKQRSSSEAKGIKAKNSKVSPSHNPSNQGAKKRSRSKHNQHSTRPVAEPWSVEQFQVPPAEGKTRFHDLDLDERLMHGIADLGFQYCSPIQAAALPHTLLGNDVIGKAQTGTGKTAAFLVTIINDLLTNPIEGERYMGEPRAVVIAPTRELVVQIADDAAALVKHTDLKVATLIGGMDYQKQLNQLQRSLVDIVVASPGRLIDFQQRGDLYLDQVEVLVIDEADRMLDMGFIPQVRRIVRSTPRKTDRQTLLFSATFTQDILNLTEQWTHEPVTVEIEPQSVATNTVDQRVYIVANEDKYRLLKNIVTQDDVESVIVFANRRDQTRKLQERLSRSGIKCGILSGEIPQNKRTRTLQDFKDGKLKVLVATDVAGRGIHVDGISHVVNYTLPEDPEDYVHRIGRTGRAGATGTSISFACEDDAFLLPTIEELLGDKLPCEQPPEELMK
jgi:ATP-dependent RNA helicase RhlB